MSVEYMTDRTDRFKENMKKGNKYSSLTEALMQNDPAARDEAEEAINRDLPQANINPNSNPDSVRRYAHRLSRRFTRLGLEEMAQSPGSMINDLRAECGSKFAKNYLSVAPIMEEGDDDEISMRHNIYSILTAKIAEVSKSNEVGAIRSFVKDTEAYIVQDLAETLGDDPEKLTKLVIATYRTSSPQEAIALVQQVASRQKALIDKAIPEARRAAYLAENLKKLAAQGDKGLTIAAQRLYEIIK